MNEVKLLTNILEYKLKKIHNYEFMKLEQQFDYDEEIKSLIPYNTDEFFLKSFLDFKSRLETKSNSSYIMFLKESFGDSWSLFVFLNITHMFTKTKLASKSTNLVENESDNPKYSNISNSYINRQTLIWGCVESFINFAVISGYDINKNIKSNVAILVLTSIHLMEDFKTISLKVNYAKTEDAYKKNIYYNKKIMSYKLNINLEITISFNIEYKFHRYPLIITDYSFPVYKRIYHSNGSREDMLVWEKRSIISGPTYIRSDDYDKSNPNHAGVFFAKDDKLRNIYSETKFYPDILFINHLKNNLYKNLDSDKIEKRMLEVKKLFETTFNSNNWDLDKIKERINIQKEYSKLLEDKKTSDFLNNNWEEHYHFSSSNDNRGRKYYCSPLTFTNFRLSRFCFHYGYNGIIDKPYFDWSKYKEILKTLKNDINDKESEIVGFYLIGLGKLHNFRKNQTKTTLVDILKKGLEIYLSNENFLYEKIKSLWLEMPLRDKSDAIECECYIYGLKQFLNGDKTKRVIIKDATASGYQIQAYLMGVSDETKLYSLNLSHEDIFVDTYLFIVDSFEKSSKTINNKIPKHLKKYFERSLIKKFCMIIPYSAGFDECFKNIIKHIDEEDLFEAGLLFKEFHIFIETELWKYMGLTSSYKTYTQSLIKKMSDTDEFTVESETAKSNLKYVLLSEKEYDTKFVEKNNYKRITTLYQISTNRYNKLKTLKAFAPNLTHFHDSDIIRILHLSPYDLKMATIHDAFIISSFECGKLVHSYGSIFKIKIRFKHDTSITCLV